MVTQKIIFLKIVYGRDEGLGALDVVGEHVVAGAGGTHEDDVAGRGQLAAGGDGGGHCVGVPDEDGRVAGGADGIFNFGGGLADEDDGFGAACDAFAEFGKVDAFVVAAGDENFGFADAFQCGQGADGGGGFGVVVPPDAVFFGDELEAVVQRAKGRDGGGDAVGCDAEMRRDGQGRGEIGTVGAAGTFVGGQKLIGDIVGTEGQRFAAGLGVVLGKPGAGDGIFGIEDGQTGLAGVERLELEDCFFGTAVGLERAVPVEVVGRQVGDDGGMGRLLYAGQLLKLEAAQFEDDLFVGGKIVEQAQERTVADVAAEPNGFQGMPGWPMPAVSRWAISEVVVLLPLAPVTATMGAGHI